MEYSIIALIIFALVGLSLKHLTNRKIKSKSPWTPPWEDKSYNPNLDDIQVVERNYTHWDLELLNKLEWKRFEEVVSE